MNQSSLLLILPSVFWTLRIHNIHIEENINHLGIDIYQHNSIDVVIKQLCSIKTAIGESFGTCAQDALDINVKLNFFYKLTFCMIGVQPFIEFVALSNYDYKYLISTDISWTYMHP